MVRCSKTEVAARCELRSASSDATGDGGDGELGHVVQEQRKVLSWSERVRDGPGCVGAEEGQSHDVGVCDEEVRIC